MALFGRKKKEDALAEPAGQGREGKKAQEAVRAPVSVKKDKERLADRDLSSVILKPLITEKAAVLGELNVYSFAVRRDATKYDVRDAVKMLFDVTPKKINIVQQKPRKFVEQRRGRSGTHPGLKKAYVYLNKGDRIDLV